MSYLIYDERAVWDDGEENAAVLDTADTMGEALIRAGELGFPCVVWEYDDVDGCLVNGRLITVVNNRRERR